MAGQIPTTSLMMLALGQYSTASGIAQSALFAVASASTAVANVPDMFKAAGEWTTIQNQIENVKSALLYTRMDLLNDWIAEDHDAFTKVLGDFQKELDDVKTYLGNAHDIINLVADAYAALWVALIAVAASLLAILLVLLALFFTPLAPEAKSMAETVASFAAKLVDYTVKLAATAITAMTAILGLSVVGLGRSIGMRVGVSPTGGATGKEDFKQIAINWTPPKEYVAPDRTLPS
jgi:hypothetical protein